MTSDRLNPMVVKELRQGLKSRGFVASFLSLQLLLVVSMVIYALNPNDLASANRLFWLMTSLVLLLFFPARATGAVLSERRQQTLELVLLSDLSASRIILGKWLSLAAQTLLVVTTLLPYLVARYFFGSLNLAVDLQVILLISLISLALSAGAVGLSSVAGRWTRNCLLWPLVFCFGVLLLTLLESLGRTGWLSAPVVGLVLLFVLAFLFFSLHFGCSQIGTGERNHALPKRLTALILPVGVTAVVSIFHVGDEYLLLIAYLLSGFMMIDALSEPLPGEMARSPRLHIPGFYPGSRSALGALAVLVLILWICGEVLGGPGPALLFPLTFANMLLFPPAVMRLARTVPENRLLFHVGLQFITFGTAIFLLILFSMGSSDLRNFPLAAFLPVLNLMRWVDSLRTGAADWVLTLFVTLLLTFLILRKPRESVRREAA